jgi:hypothetical protein
MNLACKTLILALYGTSGVCHADNLDSKTGLVVAPGFELVSTQCTVCHSPRLIIQNRADRDGWRSMIRWMQESQGLWPLGDQEALVLDYLATHYGSKSSGRRAPLPPSLLPPADAGP